jgi:1-acyl-sn-glycerol-3-phosphate acyltransferase
MSAYGLVRLVLRPVLQLLFRPAVEGASNLPVSGPYIIAGNHLSFADHFFPPLLTAQKITYLAKSEFFTETGVKGRAKRLFFESVGMVPIDRRDGSAAQAALSRGMEILAAGGIVGIYPEGTRSPDGRLYRGKTGVARLALAAGVKIVPVALSGTFEVQPAGQVLPRVRRVRVRIGEPLDFSRYAGLQDERLVLRSITDEVMYRLMLLSESEYVDDYAALVKQRALPPAA